MPSDMISYYIYIDRWCLHWILGGPPFFKVGFRFHWVLGRVPNFHRLGAACTTLLWPARHQLFIIINFSSFHHRLFIRIFIIDFLAEWSYIGCSTIKTRSCNYYFLSGAIPSPWPKRAPFPAAQAMRNCWVYSGDWICSGYRMIISIYIYMYQPVDNWRHLACNQGSCPWWWLVINPHIYFSFRGFMFPSEDSYSGMDDLHQAYQSYQLRNHQTSTYNNSWTP